MISAGKRIAHFEVLSEISRGGMGVIYEARDTKLDRRVAIKTIRGESDETARQRFITEAKAASKLGHPYICQIFDVLEEAENTFLVMELLRGETLAERIARGKLDLPEALRIAIEIAEGLREAHIHGIIHRDIKPSNLFLITSQHVKITDFGLARLTVHPPAVSVSSQAETVQASLTATGTALGTAGYMAPEQALGWTVDQRADIFSLGTVIFEMLTGINPLAGTSLAEYFHKLFTQVSPSLLEFLPGIPPALAALVASMLERDREKRPSSMEEVYRRLIEIPISAQRAGIQTRILVPKTRYTRSGEVNIAYQVLGDGPFDLVYVPGWISHLEYGWEEPRVAKFFHRLASFSRLIIFDKRGTGLSDRVSDYPTLEDRMDDVRAVMDAVGSERAAIFGMSEGGNMSILFAATYPERTIALVLCGVYAKRVWSPDYSWAPTPEQRQKWYELLEADWGGRVDIDSLAPSVANDPSFVQWWGTYLRLGASPGAALQLARFNTQIDVRHVLPSVRVPTLVLHRSGDRDVSVEEGRYIADHIAGAKFVELPGDDHLVYVGDADRLLNEIQNFLADVQVSKQIDRILTTVLCARIEKEEIRDAASYLLKQQLFRFRGRQMQSTGNELLASFDGPARAVRCGCSLVSAGQRVGLSITVGIHTGECNVVGTEFAGTSVMLVSVLASHAAPNEVLITQTVKDLVSGSPLLFQERGSQEFINIPGKWQIYSASLKNGL